MQSSLALTETGTDVNCRKPKPGMLFAGSNLLRGESHE